MATTDWYTISQLGDFNSKNGYVGGNSWYWGKYKDDNARSGYMGVGTVNGSSRNAVLVFWIKFPSFLVSSNITIDKIEVQMNQTVSNGIPSGNNYATYACAVGVQPDTPKAWNGSGQTNNPKVFATDNTVTTRTAGTTWNPTYTYKVTNRNNLPAGSSVCYIQFSGGNNSVQSMSQFTMGPSTYPKFRFTYTDSSSTPTNYTITYYRNFSTSDNTTKSGGTVASGDRYILEDCTWTRPGYSFNGWVASRSSSVIYDPGSSVQASKNQTWYAVWQPSTPNNVTFTFDPGDYSDGSKVSYSRSYAYSTREVSLPDGDDYFTGRSDSGSQEFFYLTCDCGAGSFSNGVSVAQVSNDWTRLQTQYVQNGWSLNNGVTSGDCLNRYTPDRDVTFYPYWGGERISHWEYDVVLKIPNEQPTRSGYSFVEWNTSSSGTGTSYQPVWK